MHMALVATTYSIWACRIILRRFLSLSRGLRPEVACLEYLAQLRFVHEASFSIVWLSRQWQSHHHGPQHSGRAAASINPYIWYAQESSAYPYYNIITFDNKCVSRVDQALPRLILSGNSNLPLTSPGRAWYYISAFLGLRYFQGGNL